MSIEKNKNKKQEENLRLLILNSLRKEWKIFLKRNSLIKF